MISNSSQSCPRRGEKKAAVFDTYVDAEGNFHFFDSAFRILSDPATPVETVDSFHHLLHENLHAFEQGERQQSELVETIQQQLPQFDEITKYK